MKKRTYLTIEITPQFKRAIQRGARKRLLTVTRLVTLAVCRDLKVDPAAMVNGRRLA